MTSEWIDSFTKRLLEHGLVSGETIQGCSDDEIASIESAFNVKLPNAYKDFLRRMGKKCGDFLGEAIRTYPGIVDLAPESVDNLLKANPAYSLPPTAFVFVEIYGYQFFFFDTKDGLEDPPVFRYNEGVGKPIKISESITQAFEIALQDTLYDREGSTRPYEYQFVI